MSNNRFRNVVERLPGDWESYLGSGISFFIGEQEPEEVKFTVHHDDDEVTGYSIRVRTDSDNVEEAMEFWEEHVEDKL